MKSGLQAQVKTPPQPAFTPVQVGLLQRKCACGGSAGLGGQCDQCQAKKLLGLQTKLAVGEPGDVYEREADWIAEQVMATPAHPGVSGAPPRIQRFTGQSNGQLDAVPASVDQALASPGTPLEPALRQNMEQRFGYDFSRVRVHSGAAAEQSARDVSAKAYAVGHNIVFGVGQFAPTTHEGRRLIAHELTHVVQQTGSRDATGSDPLPVRAFSAGPMLARACDPLGCPLVQLPIGVFVPSWQLAEKCLQDHYQASFPGHTVGRNKDWVGATGNNTHEQNIIDCLRPHFTAKGYKPKEEPEEVFKPEEVERQGSRQRQAEPDIFDFTNRTIMEITTPNGLAYRTKKIAWEVLLANRLMGECHIKSPNLWQIGWWSPSPCYQVVGAGAGKLFFRTWKVGGVLVYVPVLDVTREALAVVAATAAIALWKGFGSPVSKAPKVAAGPVIAATAVAALIMLANGAELSADPSEDSILEAFFKHAGDKGMNIPDDVKAALKKNKKLRDLLVKAGRRKGGDMSDEARQAMEEITKTIAEHADEFTPEELEQLVKAAEEAQAAVPNAKMSVEELKQALKSKGRGQKSEPGKTGGGGGDVPFTVPEPPTTKPPDKPASPDLPDDLRKRLAADKAADALVSEIAVEQGAGAKMDVAFVEEVLKIARAEKLTEQDVKEIANATVSTTAKGATVAELLAALKAAVASWKAVKGQAPTPAAQPGGQVPPAPLPPTPAPMAPGAGGGIDTSDTAKQAASKTDAQRAVEQLKGRSYPKITKGSYWIIYQELESVAKDAPVKGIYLIGRTPAGELYIGWPTVLPQTQVGERHWSAVVKGGTVLYTASGQMFGVLTGDKPYDLEWGPAPPARKKR